MKKKLLLILFTAFLMLQAAGCAMGSPDELYSLPKPNENFLQLQHLIDEEIEKGSEYSAPTTGILRQSVQLADLDGDGVDEALAFLKNKDMQPEICIYDSVESKYQLACRIIGDGIGIGCFEYADLNGDGLSEIMVSWRMSGDLFVVKAYSLKDWVSSVLLTSNCREFKVGDVDADGHNDVLVLGFEPGKGSLNKYSLDLDGEMVKTSSQLSPSLSAVERFELAYIDKDTPCIVVEGSSESEEGLLYLTDIFVCSGDGILKNITADGETGNSLAVRNVKVFSSDVDKDGFIEVPFAEKLYSQTKISSEYFVFDWYRYNEYGEKQFETSTYHNYSDGWFFVIPEYWRSQLSVRRVNGPTGERSVVLSLVDPETEDVEDIFTVYTLTDENRVERASLPDRFILFQGETTIYAARFNFDVKEDKAEKMKKDMTDRFKIIYTEWNTGV